jgi:hypothetical protein
VCSAGASNSCRSCVDVHLHTIHNGYFIISPEGHPYLIPQGGVHSSGSDLASRTCQATNVSSTCAAPPTYHCICTDMWQCVVWFEFTAVGHCFRSSTDSMHTYGCNAQISLCQVASLSITSSTFISRSNTCTISISINVSRMFRLTWPSPGPSVSHTPLQSP